MLTNDDMRVKLQEAVSKSKNANAWAIENGLNRGSVFLAKTRANPIGHKIAAVLGYEKKTGFFACKVKRKVQ